MNNSLSNILVASKLDDFRIVINKGADDGIDTYMRFLVYEEGQEILDPQSKKSLGKLEIPKGFFKVHHIQNQMSVLVSELKKEKSTFYSTLGPREVDVEKEQLSNIKIGDKVKVINKL